MNTYIRNFNNDYDLKYDLDDTCILFKNALPELENRVRFRSERGSLNIPCNGFIHMISHIERLFFPEDITNPPFTNKTYINAVPAFESMYYTIKNNEYTFESGFVYCQAPRTRYTEFNETHLEALEVNLKEDSHHFLKIFMCNNVLFIYTNKSLSFETIIKLKILQWNVTKENIKTEQPKIFELLQAFLDKDVITINTIIEKLLNCKVILDSKYMDLKKVFQPKYEKKIEETKNTISSYENDYLYHENQLSALVTKIVELQTSLEFLKKQAEQEEEDNTDLIRFLAKHPYIKHIEKKSQTAVDLYFEAPILYFDDYILKRIIHNHTPERQKILKVFLDNKYELITRCQIRFHTDTFQISIQYIGGNPRLIGHPHIDMYGCFGNHNLALHEAAREINYFGAIEQISQAVLNLNFSDSTVIQGMLNWLISNSHVPTWRSKETGVMLTTEELMEVYNEETTTDS